MSFPIPMLSPSLSLILLLLCFRHAFSVVDDVEKQQQQRAEGECDFPAGEQEAESIVDSSESASPNKYYGVTDSTITGCLALEENEQRPIYNSTTFERLREVYRKVRTSSHPNVMGPISDADAAHVSAGFMVPSVAARMVPGTSYRGLFATEDIPQGTLVWKPGYFGTFLTEAAWLDFLNALLELDEYGKDLACDSLQWSYVVNVIKWNEETGVWDEYPDQFMVGLDLDEASFTNHAGSEATANIADDEMMEELGIVPLVPDYKGLCTSCMYSTYAARDIQAGEQLSTDYQYFCEFGKLEWFEASVAKAWDVDRTSRQQHHNENQWHYR